jgi:hypothetical protein
MKKRRKILFSELRVFLHSSVGCGNVIYEACFLNERHVKLSEYYILSEASI